MLLLATFRIVLVRELMAMLADEDPDSPVTVEGRCPHGEYLVQKDIELLHDEGPAPETEEVNLCWTASEEAERLARERRHGSSQSHPKRLP